MIESMQKVSINTKYKTCRRLRKGMSREDVIEMRKESMVGFRNEHRLAKLAEKKLAQEKGNCVVTFYFVFCQNAVSEILKL